MSSIAYGNCLHRVLNFMTIVHIALLPGLLISYWTNLVIQSGIHPGTPLPVPLVNRPSTSASFFHPQCRIRVEYWTLHFHQRQWNPRQELKLNDVGESDEMPTFTSKRNMMSDWWATPDLGKNLRTYLPRCFYWWGPRFSWRTRRRHSA